MGCSVCRLRRPLILAVSPHNRTIRMEHIAPLIQTLLWVSLVGAIVWRFHRSIEEILSALHKRIDGGSNVKAGWFELTDQFRP